MSAARRGSSMSFQCGHSSIAAAISTIEAFSMIVTDDIGRLNAVPKQAHRMARRLRTARTTPIRPIPISRTVARLVAVGNVPNK